MAYTSGTSANYKDLMAIVAAFAAANNHTILEQSETRVYMKGLGLAGNDGIYSGIECFEDSANGYYNWELSGSWSWRAGRALVSQPMSSGGGIFCSFWNTSIPYWITANGRRILGFAKVGTVYEPFHLGLLSPYGTNKQYPYPLFVGGSGCTRTQAYTVATANHTAYWGKTTVTSGMYNGRLSVPGGLWYNLSTYNAGTQAACRSLSHTFADNTLNNLDGSYDLEEIVVVSGSDTTSTYGIVDGLFRVSGYQNTPENIITVGGINYIVFPDIYRQGNGDVVAMRMN